MNDSQFYGYVAMLLQESGHMVASSPVYINHSSQEALYLDTTKDVMVSRFERDTLSLIENVSLLVDLKWPNVVDELTETVYIFSITEDFSEQTRSQSVADIHRLLHRYWNCDHSIVFFKNRELYTVSFADKNRSNIMSDWFHIDTNYDEIIDRIHIANISLDSSNDYFTDFLYAIAREYYLYPVSFEEASYGMMPLSYLVPRADFDSSISKDEIEYMIRSNMNHFKNIYADDYIETIYEGQTEQLQYQNLSDEIERISFELELSADMDESEQTDMFKFDIDDDYDDDYEDDVDDDFFEDEDDIDPAIFDDPVLMVKWLQKRQRQLEDTEAKKFDPK